MFNNIEEVIDYVNTVKCQSHICICNSAVFDYTLQNGVYGFPRSGGHYTKSFMRSMASLYNIGINDLIFIYRMKEDGIEGNREIHGPFQIYCDENARPVIYCEDDSKSMPIKVGKNFDTDCSMRFMFKRITPKIYSVSDNFKLVEKFEKKLIWGYRHPAVMNIGAARKKSISSYSIKSTIEILDLLKREVSKDYPLNIPSEKALNNYREIKIKFDEQFLYNRCFFQNEYMVKDEAYLYAYLLNAFRSNNDSPLSKQIIEDFTKINPGLDFRSLLCNTMLEVILSPHLQDELDIVLQDYEEKTMLFIEAKKDVIDQASIEQSKRYIDLLQSIFNNKTVYANIIGFRIRPDCSIPNKYKDKIKLATYQKNNDRICFIKASNH